MPIAALILVEPSQAGNLGAAMRVAANVGAPRLELVRPAVPPDDPEVVRWACGGHRRLEIAVHPSLGIAAAPYRTLVATASARGREHQPVVTPREAARTLEARGLETAALVFGNETSGLRRADIDRCDLVVRIPTTPDFPVLNITQATAILLSYLSLEAVPPPTPGLEPATEATVEGLMSHLQSSLLTIGFLDPANPARILRKLRRLIGRAGITDNEVAILHGMCRQMEWAARSSPLAEEDSRAGDRSLS